MSKRSFTVCGICLIDRRILLVRHTYGVTKDKILLPGGYVEDGELPTSALEREIFEETQVHARTKSLFSMQFKTDQWCAVFFADYISGTPVSDGYENSEVLLLYPEEAAARLDITNMSRKIIEAYIADSENRLDKSNYINRSGSADTYAIFGVL